MTESSQHEDKITEPIIGSAFEVANTLGQGFLEKVYENSLAIEIADRGLDVVQQKSLSVRYKGHVVGEYTADLVVAGQIIVELKALRDLDSSHVGQCLNYLKATGYHTALPINFGRPKIQI